MRTGPHGPYQKAPKIIVSCPHCRPGDDSCCACNVTGSLPLEDSVRFVTNCWDAPGCLCGACARLRARFAAINRQPTTLPGRNPVWRQR